MQYSRNSLVLGGRKGVILLSAIAAGLAVQTSVAKQGSPSPAQEPSWPPAGCTKDCSAWKPVELIDFSPKHNVLIRNQDGTLTPMDQPYFKSTQIAPGTWQVLSDGDYSYLIEGDKESLVIDSTYGAGNIREYEQTLTKKPIHSIANTHYHFDHTANNAYFDRAFMSEYTKTRATIPYASFAGLNFPRNYPVTVISAGYVFHLGNRDLEVFEVPNHTMGDLAFLDRKQRVLFAGDLFSQSSMPINSESTVARFAGYLRKLEAHRSEFDRVAGGFRIEDASSVDKCLANAEYILAGHEGEPLTQQQGPPPGGMGQPHPGDQVAPPGATVYTRHFPHPGDGGMGHSGPPNPNLRRMVYGGCTITYDTRHVTD